MTTSTPSDDRPSDDAEQGIVLDDLGGGPAVATGTSREQAEQRPAVVRDSASADTPAVAQPAEE